MSQSSAVAESEENEAKFGFVPPEYGRNVTVQTSPWPAYLYLSSLEPECLGPTYHSPEKSPFPLNQRLCCSFGESNFCSHHEFTRPEA
jgi:hypothetical protein